MAGKEQRVVIIGAGHNGLVAAFYLAKAGLAPLVLERRNIAGGCAVTEEIHPGFRCPTLAHAAGPLLPEVIRDLDLGRQGLEMIRPEIRVLALQPAGAPIRIYYDADRTAAALQAVSGRDARQYPEFLSAFKKIGAVIAPGLAISPPDVDNLRAADYLNLGKLGLKFRGLDQKNAYRVLRWGPMAVADLAAEWFETELLRAVVEARGIFGTAAGPWSAGTSLGLLLQAANGGHPIAPAAFVKGGIGALTQALEKAATAAGARVQTGADVIAIRVRNGGAAGVVLANGDEISASAVISSADPRHTLLKLVEATDLDPSFLSKVRNYRSAGTVAKVNLALSALPAFAELKNGSGDLGGRIHIGPDTDYLERAFDASKYGDFSAQPYMDIAIPSITDPSLAPKGAHVMSVHVQYAPYKLKEGDWNARREQLGDAVIKALSTYAPNLSDLIVHRQVITPLDMEQSFGLTGGHIFHGEHALDQFFAFRPVLGWAQYRTPIKGLYLCGSGTHPGGGLTGAPGMIASREILKQRI